jgi:hypothetical protein
MSCFLDRKDIVETVEKSNIKYSKSILGLSNQVNSNRLRLILGKPLERHMLWVLMRKTRKKYRDHFGEEAWIYNKVDNEYENWIQKMTLAGEDSRLKKAIVMEKIDYRKFKWYIGDNSISYLAKGDGIKIGEAYRTLHGKKYFKAWDKRDNYLIRYIVNHGFYKGRFIKDCRHCGETNSRTHVTNECTTFETLRKWTWKQLKKTRVIDKYKGDLEHAILEVYFNPGDKCQAVLEVIKSFSIQLIITSCKDMKSAGLW